MHPLKKSLVLLDFDGVICDSILECLVCSWVAYFHLYLKEKPSHIDLSTKERFFQLRPYVRSGEDYLLIHEIISNRISITTQSEFDSYLKKASQSLMHNYKKLFYSARCGYLETDRNYWISLNQIYPHILKKLCSWACSRHFYILSTKKKEYILEILKANNVKIDPQRIIYSGNQRKINIITALLDNLGCTHALFVDDQIDHLTDHLTDHLLPACNKDQRIETALASWGYINAESMKREIKVITPSELAARLDSLLRSL